MSQARRVGWGVAAGLVAADAGWFTDRAPYPYLSLSIPIYPYSLLASWVLGMLAAELGAANRAQAADRARQLGLIP